MKKTAIVITLIGGFIGNSSVLADNHTISLGYAQSKFQYLKNIRGANLQYRYEWDSPISVIGSFTYLKGKSQESDRKGNSTTYKKLHSNATYYSFLAGPAYRINNYVSLYALAGLVHVKGSDKYEKYTGAVNPTSTRSSKANASSIAYGVGFAINPVENVAVNIGYEGTRVSLVKGDNRSINGFNVNVGYRF